MLRTSTIIACLLTLSAPAVMAQSIITVPPQSDGRQQAATPVSSDQSGRTFIYDEFGNVYDSRGELITSRTVKLKR